MLVASPTALVLRVVLGAQTAGETRYKDQQVVTPCHQARTLQTERLIRAHWVTLVPERILLLPLAQKENTLLLEVPLHASSVLLESTRQPMEPMVLGPIIAPLNLCDHVAHGRLHLVLNLARDA